MIWTEWLFIAIVLALTALVAWLVSKNPERYITKIYTNPLAVYGVGTTAIIAFAWFAGEHTFLEKAAFAGGSFLAIKFLGVAADFATMFKPKPAVMVTRLDINMIVMVVYSLAILAGLLNFVGVKEFADAAVESLVGAFVAALLIVGEIYQNKERGQRDSV